MDQDIAKQKSIWTYQAERTQLGYFTLPYYKYLVHKTVENLHIIYSIQ